MKKPNLFIAGAPKSGTTALVRYLEARSDVFFSCHKEPHFFASDLRGRRMMDTEEDYLRLFEDAAPEHRVLGEGSTLYLFSEAALPCIRDFDAEAKIIAMLRNPVDLVVSMHAQLLYSLDEDVREFAEAWSLQEDRMAGRRIPSRCMDPSVLQYGRVCMLGSQVQRLLSLFPPEQVLLIFFDDFSADTKAVYEITLDFLGLPRDGRTEFPRHNVRKTHRHPLIARLTQKPPAGLVRLAGGVRRLTGSRQLNILPRLRRLNRTADDPPTPTPDLLERLRSHFREDVGLLSELTGRDLGHWLGSGEA